MNIKCSIYSEDSEEFPWDENALKIFKKTITENDIKCRMDDIFLLGFLRARKYDIERSLQLLKNYYTVRRNYPHYFKNLLPSELEHVLALNIIQFLPQPDQKGRYLLTVQTGNWDISICDINYCLRTVLLLMDFQLNFHRTQQNGIVIIFDAIGLTYRHLLQYTPRLIYSMITIIFRDAYQLRFKEIHYLNLNGILTAILNLIIPLLPFKLKKRIFLHSEMNSLHEFVHPQYLPMEFGGELPSFDSTEVIKMLKENSEFFRTNEEYLNTYRESSDKFIEGRFRYIEEHQEDDALTSIEDKYNRYVEDPESYLAVSSIVEEELATEITHL